MNYLGYRKLPFICGKFVSVGRVDASFEHLIVPEYEDGKYYDYLYFELAVESCLEEAEKFLTAISLANPYKDVKMPLFSSRIYPGNAGWGQVETDFLKFIAKWLSHTDRGRLKCKRGI